MFWKSSNDDDSSILENAPFSDQRKVISDALRQADKAIQQSNFNLNTTSATGINESTARGEDESGSSYFDDATDSTMKTGIDTRTRASTYAEVTTGSTNVALNLRQNDTQFQIIADVIISKYDHLLKAGAKSFSVSITDKQQLDRMVARDNFVEAVRFRLQTCPEDSQMPIHVTTRKCRDLGLHRSGHQNLLYAPAGTVLQIERTLDQNHDTIKHAADVAIAESNNNVSKQQLLAELKEASNLMVSSVTPEAAQFWRQHVLELQTRLRNLHETNITKKKEINPSNKNVSKEIKSSNERLVNEVDPFDSILRQETEKLSSDNDKRFAALNEDTSYVAPASEDESVSIQPSDYTSWSASQRYRKSRNEPATNGFDPEIQGLPVVDVVAPANLPEGYTFEAEIEGCRFMATVPAGGVRKGQTFTCYLRDLAKVDSDIPMGRWRDGIFGCLNYGVLHPMFLNSFVCPLLALSQVMTRMGLDFMGVPTRKIPDKGIWSTMGRTATILIFWIMLNVLIICGLSYKMQKEVPISGADIAAFSLVNAAMLFYGVYATANTRSLIREKYRINDGVCGDLDDIVCSTVCMPCVVSQMGRHTISYEQHKGVCCSNTGLEPGVEGDITARRHVGSYRVW